MVIGQAAHGVEFRTHDGEQFAAADHVVTLA
jgi:hypothetical protein